MPKFTFFSGGYDGTDGGYDEARGSTYTINSKAIQTVGAYYYTYKHIVFSILAGLNRQHLLMVSYGTRPESDQAAFLFDQGISNLCRGLLYSSMIKGGR